MGRAGVLAVIALVSFIHSLPAVAAEYLVSRAADGPFATTIMGVQVNQGSSLQRESIVLNDPECPLAITSASLGFDYVDRRFQYKASTAIQASPAVSAYEVRHLIFDVFGEHLTNLSNTEVKDLNSAGAIRFSGTWNMLGENDLSEALTMVSYVARVRRADGTTWTFNADKLRAALGSLSLEKKLEAKEE